MGKHKKIICFGKGIFYLEVKFSRGGIGINEGKLFSVKVFYVGVDLMLFRC